MHIIMIASVLLQSLKTALSRAGQFAGILWERPLKVRKEFEGLKVTKLVRCCVRLGVSHDEREKVKQARQDGTLPEVNQGLPWGQWLTFPYLIVHKGEVYLRLYPVEGSKPKVQFRLYHSDGTWQPVSKEQAMAVCLASEFREVNQAIGCMTLNVRSIKRVK